jgi:hypothetical protein
MHRKAQASGLALAVLLLGSPAVHAQKEGVIGKINLATKEGVADVKGQWRYHDVMTGVGPKENEIEPKAHGKFDDSTWEVLDPTKLKTGRGAGKYCFCWYRTQITIPNSVNGNPFSGGPVWFTTVVDDYGEVWVDGEIDRAFGGSGRGCVSGFNKPNRVRLQKDTGKLDGKKKKVLRDAMPGDVFQIAVLGVNGPLGNPPGNKIFLHGFTGLEVFDAKAPGGGAKPMPKAPEPPGTLVAQANLVSKAGVGIIKGHWRRHVITVHTGANKNEIEPKAHGKFDDSKWEVVDDPALLLKAWKGTDEEFMYKFRMAWYRIQVTIPDQVDGKDVAGTAVWFKTTVDDYAEIWVNGKLDLNYGRGAIAGFNAPNEVKLTDNAKPGETIQIAVLAINAPWGNPPPNWIFFRDPTVLRFFRK